MASAALLPHLRRARDLADRCYGEPLDVATLAAHAHVSKHHFVRSFAAAYGDPPMRYLTKRRIERAQDLLRVGNVTITEVCMLVGFTSLGSFSSRFQALVGESPSAYRARWAERDGPFIPGCYLFMRGIDRWPSAGPSAASTDGPIGGPASAGVEQPRRSEPDAVAVPSPA